MTETKPSAPLPDRDARRAQTWIAWANAEIERLRADLANVQAWRRTATCDAFRQLQRAERAEAENAVLRDRLAQVEALADSTRSAFVANAIRRALSASTHTDSADETAGER